MISVVAQSFPTTQCNNSYLSNMFTTTQSRFEACLHACAPTCRFHRYHPLHLYSVAHEISIYTLLINANFTDRSPVLYPVSLLAVIDISMEISQNLRSPCFEMSLTSFGFSFTIQSDGIIEGLIPHQIASIMRTHLSLTIIECCIVILPTRR